MLINKHNTSDISKYFLHTFVKFKEEGDKIFYVKKVAPNHVLVQDKNQEEAIIDLEDDYYLDYIIPKKTVYQHGEHALFLSRIPARMWRKGMDDKNTMFQILNATGGWSQISFHIETVDGFVNKPSYYSFDDAVNNFKESSLISAALSPRISMNKNGSVYIDTTLVGKFRAGIKNMVCKAIYKEELSKVVTCPLKVIE